MGCYHPNAHLVLQRSTDDNSWWVTCNRCDEIIYERGRGDARYHDELASMGRLHDSKQDGYGTKDDPFANYHSVAEFGEVPWRYVVVRMGEKMNRLKSGLQEEKSVDVREELRDLGVMAGIARVLLDEEEAEHVPQRSGPFADQGDGTAI